MVGQDETLHMDGEDCRVAMRKILEQDLKSRFGGGIGAVSAGDKVTISDDFADFDDWADGVAD